MILQRDQLMIWTAALVAVVLWGPATEGVSPPGGRPPSSLCDLAVCGCPLGGVRLICRCDSRLQEILLQSSGDTYLPRSVGSISISGCSRVRLASNCLKDIRPLRTVSLSDIRQLDLETEAFSWDQQQPHLSEGPGIDITISNATLPLIPSDAFKGHINSLHLYNIRVSLVQPLAFANLAKMDRIELINTHINNLSPKSFSKFVVNNLIVEGGQIGRIPSYAVNSVEVLWQLRFENVHFQTIYSSAFRIREPKKFLVRSCTIGTLEGEAFRVSTKGQIFIDDNIINEIHEGAFVGVHVDPAIHGSVGTQDFIFENNTLTKFDERALTFNTSGVKLTIDRVVLNRECLCSEINAWSTKLVITSNKPTSYGKLMWCKKGKEDIVVYDYDQKHCQRSGARVNWVLAGPIALLIGLLGVSCLVYWCYRKHYRTYMNVPTKNNNRLSVLSQSSAIIDNLVTPQGKTYVETELNVLTESVEPIKEYAHPPPNKH